MFSYGIIKAIFVIVFQVQVCHYFQIWSLRKLDMKCFQKDD